MPQSVSGARVALRAALQTVVFADATTLVCTGDPGNYQPDLIVAVMGAKIPITQPTMAPTRPRDKRFTVDVVVSAYVAGGTEAQELADASATAGAELIEAYFRTSPNEKLAGTCYNAFVANMELTQAVSWEHVDGIDTPVPAGRTADVLVSVEIWVRT